MCWTEIQAKPWGRRVVKLPSLTRGCLQEAAGLNQADSTAHLQGAGTRGSFLWDQTPGKEHTAAHTCMFTCPGMNMGAHVYARANTPADTCTDTHAHSCPSHTHARPWCRAQHSCEIEILK